MQSEREDLYLKGECTMTKKTAKNRQPEAIWHLIFKSTQKKNHTQNMNNIKTAHKKELLKKK
jgi:hypothetical protein